MITRTTQVTLVKEGGNLFDEGNYTITIEDLAAGEFVKVVEENDENHVIEIDPAEWPMLRKAIDTMIKNCKGGVLTPHASLLNNKGEI